MFFAVIKWYGGSVLCFADISLQSVEDFFLIGAPERRDQKLFGSITGKTMNDGFRRQEFDTAYNDIAIFIQCHDRERIVRIITGKLRSL